MKAIKDRILFLHLMSSVFLKFFSLEWGHSVSRTDSFHNYFQSHFFFFLLFIGLENSNQLQSLQSHFFSSYYWTIITQILITLMTAYITEMLTFKQITPILWIISVQTSEFEMTFPCLKKIDAVPFKSQFVSPGGHTQSVDAIWTGICEGKRKMSHKSSNKAQNVIRVVCGKI